MKKICLTGGLASGKSTAAQYLSEQGASIIDADILGHHAYDRGTIAHQEVIKTFGEDLITEDGSIDRRLLGKKVFSDPLKLKKLTNIVWPEIRRLAQKKLNAFEDNEIVVLEAAVLIEAGWQDMGDEIWVVVVEREVAIQRCISRDGLEREAILNRLDAQISNKERRQHADVVLSNNESEEELFEQLDKQWHRLMT
ncbi:MAG: dephospho-CoA kinase [Candidatus Azotimanducaceae bacterium]|uniref:Dephospho-CoA kinase n=1 Tax=OM182 bacterium TaxID=2510334 RepID=A0A520RZL9_9GAMM|nr:dephospho-CoA kinase [Gammaproteobacteria bacterium]OUV68834.1 MAG: dephospho-CoA kinase [Gammaproteobacteria bacterium TMED133]RZO75661.1 MAG: dephospho-CoA kinase [OM182 bacterium]